MTPRTPRLMPATPCEILTFIGRGVTVRDFHQLKAALDACNPPPLRLRCARVSLYSYWLILSHSAQSFFI
jgi:plasmid replication initiation protein